MIEFCLRHWSGKAAFAAAFRRPLFSVLQEVYATMDWAGARARRDPVHEHPLAPRGDRRSPARTHPPAGCSVAGEVPSSSAPLGGSGDLRPLRKYVGPANVAHVQLPKEVWAEFENGGMSRSLGIGLPATTSPSPRPRASREVRHSCRSTSRSRATSGTSKRSRGSNAWRTWRQMG